MKRTVYLKVGTEIQTTTGYIVCTGSDAGRNPRFDVYEFDDIDAGTCKKVGNQLMTLREVAHEMHDFDGLVYTVEWADEDEEEEG